ncbi:hypothetical protein MferCBS31731_004604 [Microsporum ferrugineum]
MSTANTLIESTAPTGLASQLQQLQVQLNTLLQEYTSRASTYDTTAEEGQRSRLALILGQMLSIVKDPADQAVDMTIQGTIFVATRLFSQWGAWDLIPARSTKIATISYAELASKLDAEESLIRRIGGVLVSQGVLDQIGADQIAHTPKSLVFLEGQTQRLGCQLCWEMSLTPYISMPEYFEKYGRKEPQTINHVPATFAYGCAELSVYEMIGRDPAWAKRFSKQMEAMEVKMPIAGIYDFSWLVERLKNEPAKSKGRAVFVDIGGSIGQAIKAIMAENPSLPPSRFVLQDRQEIINGEVVAKDAELRDIAKIAVDFHKEQPTKGSYVYFIRRCCHNYPDRVVSNMLRVVAGSMAEDSRLLIQEDVMDNPPQVLAATMDVLMLGLGGTGPVDFAWCS